MSSIRSANIVAALGAALVVSGVSFGDFTSRPDGHVKIRLEEQPARVRGFVRSGRLRRVYGEAFAHGGTPEAAAARFLAANAVTVLGTTVEDLRVTGRQPILYRPATEDYAFTTLAYEQHRDGIPVFRSRLILTMRNEPDHPLVLASIDLRDLGAFRPDRARLAGGAAPGVAAARAAYPALDRFTDPEPVVFAGVDDAAVAPTLAFTFIGEDAATNGSTSRRLFVTSAEAGAILFAEDQIHEIDIAGNVSGIATDGMGADICGPELPTPFEHAYVTITGASANTDASGDFLLEDVELPAVLKSRVRGRWFRVFNESGDDAYIRLDIDEPGFVSIVHNEGNAGEFARAEVNAYIHANIARDYALRHNPAYPVIATQTEFHVNVNRDLSCNATYSGTAINFYTSGGGCPNTGFSSVVYHEYGHHLVNTAGSGQGAYGEGMADAVAVLVHDDPRLGIGFGGNCGQPLRNADNNCRYRAESCSTCGDGFHACGRLLSGCVWSLREELLQSDPSDYREILSALTINSILLHTGSSITPAITIDFLTLDDDNGNILDGTPHYAQIAAAFGGHDMPAPELTCPGDLDDSGNVDFADLLLVLAAWGPCEGCPEDIDGSGAVGFEEILYLLAQYGACQ